MQGETKTGIHFVFIEGSIYSAEPSAILKRGFALYPQPLSFQSLKKRSTLSCIGVSNIF